jgi:hypothetical protein
VYGPFNETLSSYGSDYRIYLHSTANFDSLEFFTFGGPKFRNGKLVDLLKLKISPYIFNALLDYRREYGTLITQLESYL